MPTKVCARSAGSWTACASTTAPSLPSSTASSTPGSWWSGCSSPSPTPRRSGVVPTSRTRIGAPPSSSCGRASRAEPRYGRDMPDPAVGDLGPEALAYADALYNLARYLTGNDTDAEDLVQETYSRALGSAAQFTPGTNLKAWLFRSRMPSTTSPAISRATTLTRKTWCRRHTAAPWAARRSSPPAPISRPGSSDLGCPLQPRPLSHGQRH